MRPVSHKGVSFREPLQQSLDGNTVELAVEQMEFSENSIRYSTTLNFLNSKISGLMSAIGENKIMSNIKNVFDISGRAMVLN